MEHSEERTTVTYIRPLAPKPEPRSCLMCLASFTPRNRDARYIYCSKICKDRAQQIRRYGLTIDQYRAMVLAQGGRCAICLREPSGKGFHIDHNHQTMVVRSLLCDGCNPGLGNFREDPDALRRAADYLERFAA